MPPSTVRLFELFCSNHRLLLLCSFCALHPTYAAVVCLTAYKKQTVTEDNEKHRYTITLTELLPVAAIQ